MGILYNRYTPEKIFTYSVTINIADSIDHTGGALIQTGLSGPMTPVTLSPQATYRINQPTGGSGITVTASGNDYVISGTPTADVTINCTTTRNPDLLTAEQKDLSTWSKTGGSTTYGYQHTISSTRINWNIPSATASQTKNEAYYKGLGFSQVPAGNYIFEIRYRITDLSQLDTGCRVGICRNYLNSHVNSSLNCRIDILDTQTTYTYVSTPYTRAANEEAYLVITNQYWQEVQQSRQGRIYLDQIYLREV